MRYIKEPKNGWVTPNGEITWDGTYYYVNDECYCDYLCKTQNFCEAIEAYENHCKYLDSLYNSKFINLVGL